MILWSQAFQNPVFSAQVGEKSCSKQKCTNPLQQRPPFTDPNLPSHFLISAYILQKRTQGDPGDLLDKDFCAKAWQESVTAILAEPFKALCSSSASQSCQIVMGWNSVKGERQHLLKPTAGGTQFSQCGCSHSSEKKKKKKAISTSWSNSNLTFTVPWSCYFYILFIWSQAFLLFNSDCEQHSRLRPSCLAFDTFPWIYSPHAKVVHSLL